MKIEFLWSFFWVVMEKSLSFYTFGNYSRGSIKITFHLFVFLTFILLSLSFYPISISITVMLWFKKNGILCKLKKVFLPHHDSYLLTYCLCVFWEFFSSLLNGFFMCGFSFFFPLCVTFLNPLCHFFSYLQTYFLLSGVFEI